MASNSDFISNKIDVPPGGLIAAKKWHDTELITAIKIDMIVHFLGDLGIEFDFFPSNELIAIFINEGDLLSDLSACKRRAVRLCRAPTSFRKIVIAQRTALTSEMYKTLQRFCEIEIGVAIISVNTTKDVVNLLKEMVKCEMKKESNPFLVKPKSINAPDEAIIKTLLSIPGFGDKKALLVIEEFNTLENIINASEDELAKVVGNAPAKSAYKFFNGN